MKRAGVAQLVEHQPSKLRVAGSSPVARFEVDGGGGEDGAGGEAPPLPPLPPGMRVEGQGTARNEAARVAQLVERILGKDEVRGSIPRASFGKRTEKAERSTPYSAD
jgi:hypothetical protein